MSDLASLGFGREVFRPDHEEFRRTARRFFQHEVEPNVRQWEDDGHFPAELFREAGKYGLLCAGIPEEYGGMGGDVLHHLVMHEEQAYSLAGASLEGGLATDSVAYTLLLAGTEEQKREWLPRFATGDVISEVAISEPAAGSDVQGTKTHAKRDGDDFVINGQKMWLTNGPIMTMFLLIARTDDGTSEKPSFSMFIVPVEGARGLTVGKRMEMMPKSCGGLSEVFFDDVRVPASSLVGGVEGAGLSAGFKTLALGRMVVAARALAAAELGLALTTDYVKQRQAFGQRVIDFQNTQFELASVKTELTVGRAYLDSLYRKMLDSEVDATESAIAKLWCTEAEGRALDRCLQLFGGFGFSDEYPISKMYALARGHRIQVGTSEIMRLLIARSL